MTKVQKLIKEIETELTGMTVHSLDNPAVARCNRAWTLALCETRLKGLRDARSRAALAYRLSMPPLKGSHNVRDFIACATHGMLLGALDRDEVTKLLYAAQVAHAARRPVASSTKSKKTVQNTKSPAIEQLENVSPGA